MRGYLCSSSALIAILPKSSIRLGWPKELDTFPSVLMTQTGGVELGYLGYQTATAGTRLRREEVTVQIDIFSRTSRRQTYQIGDAITPILIASGACRKIGDTDMFDEDLNVYRKLQTYSFVKYYDD